MTYQLTVSPDFSPVHLAGWYIFNTWLQRTLDTSIHLELYNSFQSQREAIAADKVDIIYANPYDASMLVREKGFRPLVSPKDAPDEAVIAVNRDYSAKQVEDLQAGVRLASTDDPDVHMMCMIMLEPAELDDSNTTRKICDSYVLVAKALLREECDVGFFLAEAFNDLSGMVRKHLRPLVTSQIHVIRHALLLGPKLAERQQAVLQELLQMADDPRGSGVLEALGFSGWEIVEQEDMEFLIDLMSTLVE